MNFFQLVILIILLSIIGLLVWNLLSLKSTKKIILGSADKSGLEGYFDLKYRLQFIATIGSIIVFSAGFWGIKSYKDFEKDSIKQVNIHKTKLNEIDSTLANIDFASLIEKGVELKKDLEILKKQTNLTSNQLIKIKDDLKYIDYNVYYFKDLRVEGVEDNRPKTKTFYYKNLINKDIEFKSRPILIHSSGEVRGLILNRGIESFDFMTSEYYSSEDLLDDKILFDLVIIGEVINQ